MEVVREFVETIVGANNVISNTVCQDVNTILLRRHPDNSIDYGFTASAEYANTWIEFLSDNGVSINSELNEFIQNWRTVDISSNPRFGLDCTRSLAGPVVFIGGKIKHQHNWFINDYDFAPHLPANTDIRDATDTIKLGYDLNEERFTSIKIYSRGNDEIHNAIGHNSFTIDANNDLTFVARTFCEHTAAFTSANNSPERWTDKAQDILDIVDKYNGEDGVGIAWRTTERVPNSEGEWEQDQGGLTFTVWQKKIRVEPDRPDDINNPYRYITQPNDNEWYSPANTANTHAE